MRLELSSRARRLALGAGVGLGVVVVLTGGAAWRVPAMVVARVEAGAEARGLWAEVEGVSVGFGGVEIDSLSVRGAKGEGFEVRAGAVEVDVGLFGLVVRGTRAVDGVSVGELAVRVRLDDATRSLVEAMRGGARAGSAEDGSARAVASVTVQRLVVEVEDGEGKLLDASGRFEGEGDAAALTVERVRIGGAPGAELVLAGVTLEGSRSRGVLALARGVVRKAELRLAEPGPEAELAGADADEADFGEEPEEEDDDDAERAARGPGDAVEGASGEGAQEPTEPPEHPTTRDRVFAAFRWLRGGAAGAGQAVLAGAEPGAAAGSTGEGGAHTLFAHLSADAKLSLEDAHVYGGDGTPVLQALRAEVSVVARDALQFTGSGKAQGGGSLSWDVQLWPGALRADGEVEARSVPLALVAPLLPALPWHEPELARLDAALRVKSERLDRIAFEGEAGLRGVALSSPRFAPEPIEGVEVSMRGRGRWLPLARRLEVDEAAVALGGVAAGLSGAVELAVDHYLLDVDARLPSTPCTEAVRAIPAVLLGDMRHARWEGRIGASVKLHADSRDLEAVELDFDIDDGCTFVEVPVTADLRRFREPFTHSVAEPEGGVFEMETGPGTLAWTRFDDISPFLVYAVLAHEDASFFGHRGFSPTHIQNALARNLAEGRYALGASTITMQLVKNVFLRREKTLARKIQEVLLTWWIERVMTKRDILELYLNVIEYGPGVYGVRNGARHYFNRLPGELSPAEAVYLSTILPSPKRYHSHFEKGEVPATWLTRMRAIFDRMRQKGWYSPAAVEYGLAELGRLRFVPEGSVTEARVIPGAARPLPGGDETLEAWGDEAEWWGDEVETGAKTEAGAGAETGADADAEAEADGDADGDADTDPRTEAAPDLADAPPPAPE